MHSISFPRRYLEIAWQIFYACQRDDDKTYRQRQKIKHKRMLGYQTDRHCGSGVNLTEASSPRIYCAFFRTVFVFINLFHSRTRNLMSFERGRKGLKYKTRVCKGKRTSARSVYMDMAKIVTFPSSKTREQILKERRLKGEAHDKKWNKQHERRVLAVLQQQETPLSEVTVIHVKSVWSLRGQYLAFYYCGKTLRPGRRHATFQRSTLQHCCPKRLVTLQ